MFDGLKQKRLVRTSKTWKAWRCLTWMLGQRRERGIVRSRERVPGDRSTNSNPRNSQIQATSLRLTTWPRITATGRQLLEFWATAGYSEDLTSAPIIEERQLPKIGEGEEILTQMTSTKKRSSEKSAEQSGAPADPVPDPEVSEKAPRPSALALALLWSANSFTRSCTEEFADLAPAQFYAQLPGDGQYVRSMQTIHSILQITRGINGSQLAIGSL